MRSIILSIFILLFAFNVKGQHISGSSINIDSLFQTHFMSLDTVMECGKEKPILFSDTRFIYLVMCISNLHINLHSYSGHPIMTVEDMVAIKKWYARNKHLITPEMVERLLYLLDPDNIPLSDEESDELENFHKRISG